MASILNRGKCGGEKIKEVINGGMTDSVHWDGGYVVRSETTYENPTNIRLLPVKNVELRCKFHFVKCPQYPQPHPFSFAGS